MKFALKMMMILLATAASAAGEPVAGVLGLELLS